MNDAVKRPSERVEELLPDVTKALMGEARDQLGAQVTDEEWEAFCKDENTEREMAPAVTISAICLVLDELHERISKLERKNP